MKAEYVTSKGRIGCLELKNRIVMPPMGVSVGGEAGYISEKDIAYYTARAKGGVGLIVSACCTVSPETCGYISVDDPVLTLPGSADRIRKLMDNVHKYDTKMIMQLIHPGRQGVPQINGGEVVGPSALQEVPYIQTPRELTNEEIKKIISDFINGAKVAFEGGADGIELHGAHGYLIHQFMSHKSNKRTDEYGGSFENRMRFVTEIIEGIKAIKPENTIISIRLNAKDGYPEGLSADECVEIAQYVEKLGVDCINLSQGTYQNSFVITEPAIFPEACRNEQIKYIKNAVNIPIIAVNNIKRVETADQLIKDGVCDFVALARGSMCDPEFGNKAATNPGLVRSCIGCDNCLTFTGTGDHARCSLNPYLGEESVYNEDTMIRDGAGKNAVVIGAGPGGMNACELLAAKGYKVTLLEKAAELGGALVLASKGLGKDKIAWTIDGYKNRLVEAGVEIKLNTEVKDAEELKVYDPAVVVVATGGYPVKPPVKGIDLPIVKQAWDVLADFADIKGKSIAIVGSGMTGLETAEVLVGNGNTVRMYDMLDEIAKGAEMTNKIAVMGHLGAAGVAFNPSHKMKEITEDGVILENLTTNEEVVDKADLVVLSLGVRPNKALESIKDVFEKVVYVGDCVTPGRIVNATRNGFEALWNI